MPFLSKLMSPRATRGADKAAPTAPTPVDIIKEDTYELFTDITDSKPSPTPKTPKKSGAFKPFATKMTFKVNKSALRKASLAAKPSLDWVDEAEPFAVVALFPFQDTESGDLAFESDQEITVSMSSPDWFCGSYQLENGEAIMGVFPKNYVRVLPSLATMDPMADSTEEDLDLDTEFRDAGEFQFSS
jgi:hypothetical protein